MKPEHVAPEPVQPNPYAAPPTSPAPTGPSSSVPKGSSGMQAYNIVSDTVVGMNVRKSDNMFQLKVIGVCVIVGGLGGAIAGLTLANPDDRGIAAFGGGLGGAVAAMVLGLFGSGIYLMIYRAVRHAKGLHD